MLVTRVSLGPPGSSTALKSGPSSLHCSSAGLLNFERVGWGCLGMVAEEGCVCVCLRGGGGCAAVLEQSMLTPSLCLTSLETSRGFLQILIGGCFTSPWQQERIPEFTPRLSPQRCFTLNWNTLVLSSECLRYAALRYLSLLTPVENREETHWPMMHLWKRLLHSWSVFSVVFKCLRVEATAENCSNISFGSCPSMSLLVPSKLASHFNYTDLHLEVNLPVEACRHRVRNLNTELQWRLENKHFISQTTDRNRNNFSQTEHLAPP